MDKRKQQLTGSEAADEFKAFHKTGPVKFYAADGDLFLVSKFPRGIVALIDYKNPRTDRHIPYGSAVLYESLISQGHAVFVVFSVPPFERITVKRIISIDPLPDPPEVITEMILKNGRKSDFWKWEGQLRQEYSNKR